MYLILYIAVLPWLVPLLASRSGLSFDRIQVNFLYFSLNLAVTLVIFRCFLVQSFRDALTAPGAVLWGTILGYLGSMTLGNFVGSFILQLDPDFANVNDMSINVLVAENFAVMALGGVIMAPIAEELLFRGLIFRGLYDRSPLAAHLVSMALFSAIHITGYIGHFAPKTLFLCFIQYLPVAYCLNFAYRRSGSIVAPILMHMLNNLMALNATR